MSQPNFNQVHQNVPLTNLSVAFFQDPSNYGAMSVFPRVPVDKASNLYYTYDRSYFLTNNARYRAAGAAAPLGDYKVSTSTYTVQRKSIGKDVDDPTRANADPQFDLDQEAAMYINQQLYTAMEQDWATAYFNTGIWTTNPTTNTKWNDASSDPVGDIRTNRRTVVGLCGPQHDPNVLVLGAQVFDNLCEHPDIIDRIKYTAGAGNPAVANANTLAQLFGVERVITLKSIYNSGPEGGTASYSFNITSTAALLAYAAPNPGLKTASAGYTFMWTAAPDGSSFGPAIKTWRDEKHERDIHEGNVWYQFAKISADLGVFFSAVVS